MMLFRTEVAFTDRSQQAARSPIYVDISSYECYCEGLTRDEDFGATAQEHQEEKKTILTSRSWREKTVVGRT